MAILQVNYVSDALFRMVTLNVILPIDKVDPQGAYINKGKKFKTLYLLHGLLGNYTDWVHGTRVQRWAQEHDLAVVMPSADNSFYVNTAAPRNDYGKFIGEELVNVTRMMFPLSDKKEDTFIAGLSMGGYGAMRNGLKYSDTFSHIASFSGALHIADEKGVHPGWGTQLLQNDTSVIVLCHHLHYRSIYRQIYIRAYFHGCNICQICFLDYSVVDIMESSFTQMHIHLS